MSGAVTTLLPKGFETLESFADRWAAESASERASLRAAYTENERAALHAACSPLLKSALAYLDGKPLAEHDDAEKRLMRLILSFAHVSLAVEVQCNDEAKHQRLRESMRITHASADL